MHAFIEKLPVGEEPFYSEYVAMMSAYCSNPVGEETLVEVHHILPRSLVTDSTKEFEDSPENLVRLKLADHFEAHRLLWKAYPSSKKLMFAFYRMCVELKYEGHWSNATAAEYEAVRIDFVQAMKTDFNYMKQITHEEHPMYGKKHTEEARKKISEATKRAYENGLGPWNKRKDKEYTEEERAHMSRIAKKAWDDPEYRQRQKEAHRGQAPTRTGPMSEESRRKMSESGKLRAERKRLEKLKKLEESPAFWD